MRFPRFLAAHDKEFSHAVMVQRPSALQGDAAAGGIAVEAVAQVKAAGKALPDSAAAVGNANGIVAAPDAVGRFQTHLHRSAAGQCVHHSLRPVGRLRRAGGIVQKVVVGLPLGTVKGVEHHAMV